MTPASKFDPILTTITDYVTTADVDRPLAMQTALFCLMDSLGCALQALETPACRKLIGPIVPGAELKPGVRVPGTGYHLDPVQGAFCIGTLIRWLDYNDTWLAAEWGHPSDNLGAILAIADYRDGVTMNEVLSALIKAQEIQGVLALENSFNAVGLDHVILVKIASTAVAAQMLGGSDDQILNALSNAWVDGQSLRTYRHFPNTGSRKSWAAGDATSRAVRLALMSLTGEMGYPTALSAPKWGFHDVLFNGKPVVINQPLGTYVMENILFKISYPAEFHAQTALECAIALHPRVRDRIDAIDQITLHTQEPAVRIIDKTGPLQNPADRDHCLQYIAAVGLLFGTLDATSYEDDFAATPAIDALREKMVVVENPKYSRDYLDPKKRAIANAIEITFTDGSDRVFEECHYPVGHPKRRDEGIPLLLDKFRASLTPHFDADRSTAIWETFQDLDSFLKLPAREFMSLWEIEEAQ